MLYDESGVTVAIDRLTIADAYRFKDPVEKAFAIKVIRPGFRVMAQIPVGDSLIDFRIVNLNNPYSVAKGGQLVEVTHSEAKECFKRNQDGSLDRNSFVRSRIRKKRQYDNMLTHHGRGVILFGENIKNILKRQ